MVVNAKIRYAWVRRIELKHRIITCIRAGVILTVASVLAVRGEGTGDETKQTKNLEIQFADAFNEQSCRSGGLDAARWMPLKDEVKCENGYAVIRATNTTFIGPGTGPAPMAIAGMASKQQYFNSGLAGTNLVEIDFLGYTGYGAYLNTWLAPYGRVSGFESSADGRYEMGFSLQMGNFSGRIGSGRVLEADRGLQVQFDWWARRGLVVLLGRNYVLGDEKLYPQWDPEKVSFDEIKSRPFIDQSFVVLSVRSFAPSELDPSRHRYGLGCTDNGNKLFWTLDGKVRDTVDIKGFFDSRPQALKDGAYMSIMGVSSYEHTVWKYGNVRISVSHP